MFINDDLAVNHKEYVSEVLEIKQFDRYGAFQNYWIVTVIRWLFRKPNKKKYLYDMVLGIETNIFKTQDCIIINNHEMLITDTDVFNDTIWCVSLDWTDDFFTDHEILRSGRIIKF